MLCVETFLRRQQHNSTVIQVKTIAISYSQHLFHWFWFSFVRCAIRPDADADADAIFLTSHCLCMIWPTQSNHRLSQYFQCVNFHFIRWIVTNTNNNSKQATPVSVSYLIENSITQTICLFIYLWSSAEGFDCRLWPPLSRLLLLLLRLLLVEAFVDCVHSFFTTGRDSSSIMRISSAWQALGSFGNVLLPNKMQHSTLKPSGL